MSLLKIYLYLNKLKNFPNSRNTYEFSYDNNNSKSIYINNDKDNEDKRTLYPIRYLTRYNIYTSNKTLVFLQKDSNSLFF